jgi:hypothetical protein
VLALARMLGSSIARELEQRADARGWRPGERVFRRTLAIDGAQPAQGSFELALQLTEVRFAPAPEIARPTQRIAHIHEVRAHAALEIGGSGLSRMGGIELRSLRLEERVRSRDTLVDERWTDLPEASALAGAPLTGAVTPRILAAFPDRSAGDPAIDLVLQLVPGLLQSASSALGDAWPALASHSASAMVCEGPTDSCYIWRSGGALHAACRAEAKDATG